MINIKGLLEIYDWLGKQPGGVAKVHASTLETIIFDDLIYREKRYLGNGQTKYDDLSSDGVTKHSMQLFSTVIRLISSRTDAVTKWSHHALVPLRPQQWVFHRSLVRA